MDTNLWPDGYLREPLFPIDELVKFIVVEVQVGLRPLRRVVEDAQDCDDIRNVLTGIFGI